MSRFLFLTICFFAGHSFAQTTANVVYGQGGSFTSGGSNKGGISANSLIAPEGITVDSTSNLYISDTFNSRILYFQQGSTTAIKVYGQAGSFTSATVNNGGVTADSLNAPRQIALDTTGSLYVADSGNHRVLYFQKPSTTATRVYGQLGSFTSNVPNKVGLQSTSLNSPTSIALDSSNNLYVADAGNNRVLFYPSGQTTPTVVYGQGGSFTTSNSGTSASLFMAPVDVILDSSGNLYVTDKQNSRVLFFPSGQTTATRVYGQPSFTSSSQGTSSTSMKMPSGSAIDSLGNLYVADAGNSRILLFPAGATTATTVYGQLGIFTTGIGNNGGITANSLNTPISVSVDSTGNLYIADSLNNRVLYYGPPFTTGTTTGSPTTAPASTTCFHESTIITYKSKNYSLKELQNHKECHIPHIVKAKGFKIVTRCGTVTLTEDHLVYTDKGLQKVEHLRVGDRVYCNIQEKESCPIKEIIPEEKEENYFGLNCLESVVLANGIKTSTFGNFHTIPATWMSVLGETFGIKRASNWGDYFANLLFRLKLL